MRGVKALKRLPKTKKALREYEARCAFVRTFVEAGKAPPAGYDDVLEDVLIAMGRHRPQEAPAEPTLAWEDMIPLRMSKDATVNRSVLPDVAEAVAFVRGFFPGAVVTEVRASPDQASALQSALDAGGH